jgi:hypothetical protein
MLRNFLWANCFSCAVFGVLFVAMPQEVTRFVGSPPAMIITALGLLLCINAVLLAVTATKLSHLSKVVLFFVLGDAGWVALTAACLIFGFWIEGAAATVVSIVVALVVGGLGIGQYRHGVAGKLV